MSEAGRVSSDDLVDRLVHINRIAKVVKGGRRFSFAALVVVGDQKGSAGFGHGKAREVPEAVSKATDIAQREMVRIPLREGRTLHHEVIGRFGAGRALLRPAPPGTGIIAGGPMRAVFESLGVQDVVAKSLGSSNPYNMVRAVFDALSQQNSPAEVARRRGKKTGDIVGQRRSASSDKERAAEAARKAEADEKKAANKAKEGDKKKASADKKDKKPAAKKSAAKKPAVKKAVVKKAVAKKAPAKKADDK